MKNLLSAMVKLLLPVLKGCITIIIFVLLLPFRIFGAICSGSTKPGGGGFMQSYSSSDGRYN